jgi:hypothetical protein
MSEMHDNGSIEEVPLDFTEFLSRRLGMETGTALSVLGSFLVTFEPLGRGAARATARPLQQPATFTT